MPNRICPKCSKILHPGGLGGHLRFSHKVKQPELQKLLDTAEEDHSDEILHGWDELKELREKLAELDWLEKHNKLPYSKKEFSVIRRALVAKLADLENTERAKWKLLSVTPIEPGAARAFRAMMKRIGEAEQKSFNEKMRAKWNG